MLLKIDQEFKNLIPPLTYEERELLERNIVKEGCRDPIVLWDNTIVDGHNRYDICISHDLEFKTVEIGLSDRNDVINWIIDNQLGKRNISQQVRMYLIGKRYQNEKKAVGAPVNNINAITVKKNQLPQNDVIKHIRQLKPTAERIAEQNKVSKATVERAESFAESIDKIAEISGKTATSILKEVKVTQEEAKKVTSLAPETQKEIVTKVMSGEIRTFKEALKPVTVTKRIKTSNEGDEVDAQPDFNETCQISIPVKSKVMLCPCGCGYGYSEATGQWYTKEQYNNL